MMKRIAEGATLIFLACGLSKYSDNAEPQIFENRSPNWLLLSVSASNWILIMETVFLSSATEKEIP